MEKKHKEQLVKTVKGAISDLIDVYEGDAETAILWLLEPLQALNGERPIDCFSDQTKTLQLQALIKKIDRGDFS